MDWFWNTQMVWLTTTVIWKSTSKILYCTSISVLMHFTFFAPQNRTVNLSVKPGRIHTKLLGLRKWGRRGPGVCHTDDPFHRANIQHKGPEAYRDSDKAPPHFYRQTTYFFPSYRLGRLITLYFSKALCWKGWGKGPFSSLIDQDEAMGGTFR